MILFFVCASQSVILAQNRINTDSISRRWLDVPYASLSPAQKLDVYLPEEGDGPFPVIVSIHGGAFRFGDKADGQLRPMLEGLNRGYAVISINYRMSGEAHFPKAVHDVKAAIRWIRAHANDYFLHADKIALWGGSAGGHLSAMAGLTGGVAELEDLTLGYPEQSSRVQAVVDWFGPTDFLKMDEQLIASGMGKPDHNESESPESLYLGEKITEIPELVAKSNPETYITEDDPPFFIQHGTDDQLVPVEQSIYFAARLKEVLGGKKVTLELLPGVKHGGPAFESKENLAKVYVFLDQYLKE
ncbi:alpha/beta hydrolase [candidate division KSB1 bacterium]|nr:alpha/beta hydrolase [candidate division KSB1 bacterium]RQW03361.1 MAG: alpha/beta hydrolase [candidate division KSB1 bacterium]